MKVLLITQYFAPETGGTSNRLVSIAQGLRDAGHEVTVIAEKPNHPEGVIWPEYREGWFLARAYEGIPVVYTWVWTCPTKTFASRLLFYLSFMAMAVAAALRARGRYDVVLASSPPLFVGLAGWAASRLKGSRFVLDVRDVWPDVAVAVGALRPGPALRLAERVEAFVYRRAHGITAVTEGFCRQIRERAPRGTAVERVSNGTVPELFAARAEDSAIRARLGLEEHYVVTYAGNVGLAQGFAHVLDAAERLAGKDPAVHFLFVGDGAVRRPLAAETARRGLSNVTFLPRVPLAEAARYMAASDALLVPLARHDLYRMFIPSKLFDGMASGRPVLLSVDGEARAILEEAGGGVYYPAEDAEALVERILWLRANPPAAVEMGRRGAEYVRTRFVRRLEAARLARFLERVAGPGAPP